MTDPRLLEIVERGACRGLDHLDWVPDREYVRVGPGQPWRLSKHVEALIAVCAGCPVRALCADYAIDTYQVGVWGGTTTEQRRQLRRGGPSRPPGRPAARCGTESGYRAHYRRGEAVCPACREAERAARARRGRDPYRPVTHPLLPEIAAWILAEVWAAGGTCPPLTAPACERWQVSKHTVRAARQAAGITVQGRGPAAMWVLDMTTAPIPHPQEATA